MSELSEAPVEGGGRRMPSVSVRVPGTTRARGEFIAFLDQDDLPLPGKLKSHLDCFAAHPDADLTFGWSRRTSLEKAGPRKIGTGSMVRSLWLQAREIGTGSMVRSLKLGTMLPVPNFRAII